jgi:hypothetical protein
MKFDRRGVRGPLISRKASRYCSALVLLCSSCVPVGTREVLDCVASDADDVTDDFGVFKRPIRVLRSLFSAA